MKLLRAVLALLLALALQAALGRLWPESQRYVDVMLVPVVWYGTTGSQRRAMLVGCAAGLLQDSWFQVGRFGLEGFKKTLLGYTLGGVASRLDLNQPAGRLLAGSLTSLGDQFLDTGLRSLLDERPLFPRVSEVLVRAVVTGLLVALVGRMLDRVRERRAFLHD